MNFLQAEDGIRDVHCRSRREGLSQDRWQVPKREPANNHFWRNTMTNRIARRFAASVAFAALGLATPALAQDKTVKIGVLNDMSSLYADIGGPNSVAAVKMAVEDSGLVAKGWNIEVLSGDHQNKPH